MTDYVCRGVTQSNHKPSVAAYFEPRYNINDRSAALCRRLRREHQVRRTTRRPKSTSTAASGRPSGPFALDVGFWYYYYPGGTCYYGVGASPAARLTICRTATSPRPTPASTKSTARSPTPWATCAFGANVYYTPSFANTGAWGDYAVGHGQIHRAGEDGAGSARLVRVGRVRPSVARHERCVLRRAVGASAAGIDYTDYDTWNIGLGFTWKVFTLDLRYSDTDLQQG